MPAGARKEGTNRRRLALRLSFLVATALLAACDGDGDQAPTSLMDGSPLLAAPVELEDVEGPTILTSVHVIDVTAIRAGTPEHECLHRPSQDARAVGRVVRRVGAYGESVTFRDDGRGLHACDNTLGPRADDRRWCGAAYGELFDGRLRDPRLDIGCVTPDGKQTGWVWVQPHNEAKYVVVYEPGYAEVYEIASGLPVRVATSSGVIIEGSRAAFELSEHDAAGKRLRRYRLDAVVAG